MRLFNPFKAHVVEFATGEVAVRVLTLQGFKYYSCNGTNTWATSKCVNKYCRLKTIEEAEELLDKLNK